MGQITTKKTDSPVTPPSGYESIYIDTTGQPKKIDSGGTSTPLAGISDAASDGKVRARKDAAWVEVQPLNKDPYLSQAAMLADQANQIAGFLYNDGTSTWAKLATSTGVIGDYVKVGDISGSGVQTLTGDGVGGTSTDKTITQYPVYTSATEIDFTAPKTFGSFTTPLTGALTDSFTGANPIVQEIFYQGASFTEPSAAWEELEGVGYDAVGVNFIVAEYFPEDGKVIYQFKKFV